MIRRAIFIFLFIYSSGLTQVYSKNPELKSKINEIFSRVPASTSVSVLILDPLDKDTIFALNPKEALVPASNIKLFTTVVAMNMYGPNYEIPTVLYSDTEPDDKGVINGNLYIKGFGNGLFDTKDLESFVEGLKSFGITRITGDILGDDSFLDNEYSRNDWLEDDNNAQLIPPVSALVLDRNRKTERRRIRRNRYRTVSVNIANPPAHAAQALLNSLKKNKITVLGTSGVGITPEDAFELGRVSVKMSDIVSIVNKRSDNFLAEILFKLIGRKKGQNENNGYFASQEIKRFLIENDIYANGTQIADGSGLSHYNFSSAASLTSLLEWVYINMDFYDSFITTLSVAGIDGTLGRRMSSISPAYKFYGKTGTLRGSTSVSGFLSSVYNRDLIVSILFQHNHGSGDFYKNIQDDVIKLLSSSFE
ncbi:MAG: D-alanyl-D-alanine carboxypeptidase [Ignavibacteriaceae bacterium]|nr:D-alanyl-D-alanine carboxypeptidase [Ignavibacteriaceae bacterium]